MAFNKYSKGIALFLLAVFILWWFGRSLDWAEVNRSVRQANVLLLGAATLLVSLTYLLRAYRWRALLRPLGQAHIRDLFVATVTGFSAVFLVGRAGEVVRPGLLTLRDRKIRPAASFITIVVERICDLVAIILMFAVNLTWFRLPLGHEADLMQIRKIGLGLLITTVVGLVILIVFERKAGWVIGWLERRVSFIPANAKRFLVRILEQLAAALKVLAYPRELIITSFWTGLIWSIVIVANLLILSAFGESFGVRETIFVLGWALVGSLVPTPGGAAGAFHAATAAGLVFLGVTREIAAAIAIALHIVDFAPALLFGLYYLIMGDVSITRLRKLPSTEHTEVALEQ